MGIGDKAKHAAEEAIGNMKEGLGKATDNDDLKREGQADQAEANVKKIGDDIKDVFDK